MLGRALIMIMTSIRTMALAAVVGAAVCLAAPVSIQNAYAAKAAATVNAEQAKQDLKDMLSKLSAFSAKFRQELSDGNGGLIADGSGELYLKRPHSFIMYTDSPDVTVLYTKDKDIYFYDEVVNQVSIFSTTAISSNPMMLLSGNDESVWNDYNVTRDGDRFTLTPVSGSDIQSLTISFVPEAKSKGSVQLLESLTLRMDDGNTNFYLFTKQSANAADEKFDFKLPKDVEVDDQR